MWNEHSGLTGLTDICLSVDASFFGGYCIVIDICNLYTDISYSSICAQLSPTSALMQTWVKLDYLVFVATISYVIP